MGLFVSVKRYVGVSYYESEKRRWEGKPDRCYYIRYPDGAGTKREKVGWSSEGVDAAFASRERAKRIAGDGVDGSQILGADRAVCPPDAKRQGAWG